MGVCDWFPPSNHISPDAGTRLPRREAGTVLNAFNPKNGSDIYGPLVVVGIQSNDSGLGAMPSHRNPFINF